MPTKIIKVGNSDKVKRLYNRTINVIVNYYKMYKITLCIMYK